LRVILPPSIAFGHGIVVEPQLSTPTRWALKKSKPKIKL